jgi:glutamine synthetase
VRFYRPPIDAGHLDQSPDGAMSLDELQHFDEFLNDVYDACELQGIPADAAISENGAGQFEINMRHVADPLRAACRPALTRRPVSLGAMRTEPRPSVFPAEPITGNAYSMNLDNLPLDWATAIDAFRKGADVPTIFSKRLQTMLVECKMQELRKFARYVTKFEYDSYLEIV